jgi:hypothetical protein
MYDQNDRINPKDRWAIIAYIRALQLSQSVKYADLSAQEQQLVAESAQKRAEPPQHEGEAPSHPK